MNGSRRISRARGKAHLPLVIVAVLALLVIVLGKVESTLFDKTRSGVIDGVRPLLTASYAPLEAVGRWFGSIGNIFVVYQENLKLKDEIARLKQWQNTAAVLNERIRRYQLLLRAVPDPALSSVVAKVIGRSNHPFLQTVILDAGSEASVKPGQAVIDQRGMIGRIYLTGKRTSWVILLTDLNSRIPVSVEPNTDQAIMSGDNSDMPLIETLARDVTLKEGAQVVSSGDGDLLPGGIPIGIVVKDGNHYRVRLFADQTTAQDVEIVDFKLKAEHPPASAQQELPVTAAGLAPATAPQGVSGAIPAPPPPVYVPPQAAQQPPSAPSAPADADNDVPNAGNQ